MVTGMLTTGKSKMGNGWVLIIDENEYQEIYERILSFSIKNNKLEF